MVEIAWPVALVISPAASADSFIRVSIAMTAAMLLSFSLFSVLEARTGFYHVDFLLWKVRERLGPGFSSRRLVCQQSSQTIQCQRPYLVD